MGMTTDAASLLLLLNWMSPAFPTGGFAYSHGLEQAILDGRLADESAAENWIAALVQSGSGWNDAVLFARSFEGDTDALNALALALASSRERYIETTELGRAFSAAAAVWTGRERDGGDIAYPIAAGRACRAMGAPRDAALTAFLHGFSAALVSVAVRLVPIGQMAGLRVLRNLAPVITATATRARDATLDDLGSCCVAADIAAIHHETLSPRIFRT
jgi:urease accessory protein